MQPTFGNGKICYIEIPAADPKRSADFYSKVFNWPTRQRPDGSIAFDDGVGQVSGTWVVGPKPSTSPTLLVHIMVDDMSKTLILVAAHGGKITQPVGAHPPEITAQFADPFGNIWGLYQHRSSKSS